MTKNKKLYVTEYIIAFMEKKNKKELMTPSSDNLDHKYMVCTRCQTYNHERFIEDAMNGFTMQRTNFPVVTIIIDDASTDNNATVINDYFHSHFDTKDKTIAYTEQLDNGTLHFARHKTNRNCFFAIILLAENLYQQGRGKEKGKYIKKWQEHSKYIALCEGDDYWTDPMKLQKQVDFLESNPHYGLIYTDYYERKDDKIIPGTFPILEGECLKPYLLRKGFIPTPTTLFSASIYASIDKEYTKLGFKMGDVPVWIQFMHDSKIKRLPEKTAVYRILEESASHSKKFIKQMEFYTSAWEVRKYFAERYGYKDISDKISFYIKQNYLLMDFYKGYYWKFFWGNPLKYKIGIHKLKKLIRIRKKERHESKD